MGRRQNILVLGGTGFIGSELLATLRSIDSRYNVLVLVNRTDAAVSLEHFETIRGSLGSFDLRAAESFNPDLIVHMARNRGSGALGRLLAAEKGARANRRLLSWMKGREAPPRLLYVSGTLMYGDCGRGSVTEEQPLNPTAFASQYILAERPFIKESAKGGVPVSMLRPPWVMGTASWFKGYYLDTMSRFGFVPQYGDGKNIMSFIDVTDCAGLIELAASSGVPGQNYNLFVPGAAIEQREFASLLSDISGLPLRVFNRSEVRKRYGDTVWKAFTFSLNASTVNKGFIEGYTFKYPTVRSMVEKNLDITAGA